jgi:hypothetical protein
MSGNSELTTGGKSVAMSRNVFCRSRPHLPELRSEEMQHVTLRHLEFRRHSGRKLRERSCHDRHHLGGNHAHLLRSLSGVGVLARPRRFLFSLSAVGAPQLIEPFLLDRVDDRIAGWRWRGLPGRRRRQCLGGGRSSLVPTPLPGS